MLTALHHQQPAAAGPQRFLSGRVTTTPPLSPV